MRVIVILELKSVFVGSCLKNCKSDYNQTWIKDTIGVPSYAHEVKGHVELFLCKLL